jgi:hypothetical protein
MGALLKLLWPALIPLAVYVAYMAWRARRKARGMPVADIKNLGFYAVVSSLVLAIALFALLAVSQPRMQTMHYQPAALDRDGSLIRSKVSP